jgi:hypothetical protein
MHSRLLCADCGNGHDYKATWGFRRHVDSAARKRRVGPGFEPCLHLMQQAALVCKYSAQQMLALDAVRRTCAKHLCQQLLALDAALVRSTFFQCSRLRLLRCTGPYDSSMGTSTRAYSDMRATYADTAEHAWLFKSISAV